MSVVPVLLGYTYTQVDWCIL